MTPTEYRRQEIQESGARLHDALIEWAEHLSAFKMQNQNYQTAYEAIDSALVETISYMRKREAGEERNLRDENHLSHLWIVASRALDAVDQKIANASYMKGLGWTDPNYWEEAKSRGFNISVSDMVEARLLLIKNRDRMVYTPKVSSNRIKSSQIILLSVLAIAGLFGIFCIYAGLALIPSIFPGDTTLDFLGFHITTKHASIASIGIGAVVTVMTLRRVIKSVELLAKM